MQHGPPHGPHLRLPAGRHAGLQGHHHPAAGRGAAGKTGRAGETRILRCELLLIFKAYEMSSCFHPPPLASIILSKELFRGQTDLSQSQTRQRALLYYSPRSQRSNHTNPTHPSPAETEEKLRRADVSLRPPSAPWARLSGAISLNVFESDQSRAAGKPGVRGVQLALRGGGCME